MAWSKRNGIRVLIGLSALTLPVGTAAMRIDHRPPGANADTHEFRLNSSSWRTMPAPRPEIGISVDGQRRSAEPASAPDTSHESGATEAPPVASGTRATEPIMLRDHTGPIAWVRASAPASAPAPVTVILHGQCSSAEWTCPAFEPGIAKNQFVVCPVAHARCSNGGHTWIVARTHERIEEALASIERRFGDGSVDRARVTLVGHSLGATAAAYASRDGHYPRLVLIAGSVPLFPTELRARGVERVTLMAGDYDETHRSLSLTAARLRAQGVTASMVSLGPVGHWLPESFPELLRSVLEDEPAVMLSANLRH